MSAQSSGTRVLPSWNDGHARDRILAFVDEVTDGDPAVPIPERIAVFDNDGTLWTEKPVPPQLHFLLEQWRAAGEGDERLAGREPYAGATSGDLSWLARAVSDHRAGRDSELHTAIAAILATTTGLGVDEYEERVARFFDTATHVTRAVSYAATRYQPMLELLELLRRNQFRCYIVSGSDRDFMRPISDRFYGLPREAVIGSAVGLIYEETQGELSYADSFEYIDDGALKPARIWARLGRRPLFAAGNSDGDLPMLGFVARERPTLSLLVHHDDDDRDDAAYDDGAERALAVAEERHLVVVSVARDWSKVFASSDDTSRISSWPAIAG